ncbi:unnamed protein product [Lupinus luteus]|uniref:Uncharacterized protein n=1 Tax=Lupinus luteus TaxID=3873 RepID=A0AAV1YB37_LUPLU
MVKQKYINIYITLQKNQNTNKTFQRLVYFKCKRLMKKYQNDKRAGHQFSKVIKHQKNSDANYPFTTSDSSYAHHNFHFIIFPIIKFYTITILNKNNLFNIFKQKHTKHGR